jgi:hypothetical protein
MTSPIDPGAGDDLDFDRAIPGSTAGDVAARSGTVQCALCKREVRGEYFTVGDAPLCASCRVGLEQSTAPVRDPVLLARAAVFGFGAALVGGAIYWAVMRFLNLEIGLIAVLCGYMVGKAMRVGANGRGGLALQIGAAALTYVSVAMAYFPFAMQSAMAADPSVSVSVASMIPIALFALTLPVVVILGSMPSGIISAAIIGFGIFQAWQLTAAPGFVFGGPYRLGDGGPR